MSDLDWQQISDDLLRADVGPQVTSQVVSTLRKKAAARGVSTPEEAQLLLAETLTEMLLPDEERELNLAGNSPLVILMVGVNGAGKTTSVAKLARRLITTGRSVVVGAADTFRAAAVEQLQTWSQRVGAVFVSGSSGADPASVAFEALQAAKEQGIDCVIIDTAGRLHTSGALMDELAKVRRVLEKQVEIGECLLVIDATTGQNGINQARAFTDTVGVTGVVLTKLDGSARGGVILAIEQELRVPVKFIGTGEAADDLEPFSAAEFIEAFVTHS